MCLCLWVCVTLSANYYEWYLSDRPVECELVVDLVNFLEAGLVFQTEHQDDCIHPGCKLRKRKRKRNGTSGNSWEWTESRDEKDWVGLQFLTHLSVWQFCLFPDNQEVALSINQDVLDVLTSCRCGKKTKPQDFIGIHRFPNHVLVKSQPTLDSPDCPPTRMLLSSSTRHEFFTVQKQIIFCDVAVSHDSSVPAGTTPH